MGQEDQEKINRARAALAKLGLGSHGAIEYSARNLTVLPEEMINTISILTSRHREEAILYKQPKISRDQFLNSILFSNKELREEILWWLNAPEDVKISRAKEVLGKDDVEPGKHFSKSEYVHWIRQIVEAYPIVEPSLMVMSMPGRMDRLSYGNGRRDELLFWTIPEMRLATDTLADRRNRRAVAQMGRFISSSRGRRHGYNDSDIYYDAILCNPEIYNTMNSLYPNLDYRLAFHPEGKYNETRLTI